MLASNLEIAEIAINKLLDKATKGINIAPGKLEIDETITLRVKATITKSEDVLYTPTTSVPLIAALALVLDKSGVTREHAARILQEALTEAIEAGEEAEGSVLERIKDVEAAVERVQAVTGNLPKKVRAGATKVVGSVEVVSSQLIAA